MCNVEQAFQWSKEGIPKMADEEKQGRHPKWQKMSVKVTHAIFGYVAAWSDTQAEEKKRRICWITLIRYMLGLSRRMWWKDKRWLHARSEGGKGLKEKKETCKWVIPVFFFPIPRPIYNRWNHIQMATCGTWYVSTRLSPTLDKNPGISILLMTQHHSKYLSLFLVTKGAGLMKIVAATAKSCREWVGPCI